MTSAEGKMLKIRQRSCIACGEKDDKRTLYRVVRTAEGEIFLDPSGRVAGRGAYFCSADCLEKACKQGKLAKSFKMKVEAETYEKIRDQFSQLLSENM